MAKEKEFIKFLKIREVKNPSRGFPTDAGIDFYVPEFNLKFIEDLKSKNPDIFDPKPQTTSINGCCISSSSSGIISLRANGSMVDYDLKDKNDTLIKFDETCCENYFLLAPHSRVLIPSGIKSRMSSAGRALIASNKSGVATKHGLVFGAQVVDYSYQGEIHISVINTSSKVVRIYENMKLIQFIETPIFTSEIAVTVADVDNNFDLSLKVATADFYNGMVLDRGDAGFGSTDKK